MPEVARAPGTRSAADVPVSVKPGGYTPAIRSNEDDWRSKSKKSSGAIMLASAREISRPDGDETIGIRMGQRPQQHSMDDRKYRDVDADAE